MNIKAEVISMLNNFEAEVQFSETAVSFYGPSWEIGFFFGLLPIRGKTKELLRIEYNDIAEVRVGQTSRPFFKKDACLIKMQNGLQLEIAFTPFQPGCGMLFQKVGNRFV